MQHAGLELCLLAVRQIGVLGYFHRNRFVRVKSRYFNLVVLFVKQVSHLVTHLQLLASPHFERHIPHLRIAETPVYFVVQLLGVKLDVAQDKLAPGPLGRDQLGGYVYIFSHSEKEGVALDSTLGALGCAVEPEGVFGVRAEEFFILDFIFRRVVGEHPLAFEFPIHLPLAIVARVALEGHDAAAALVPLGVGLVALLDG